MSERKAQNITYKNFLTSQLEEHEEVACHKLEIPEFQRYYVWKPAQIIELINSIKNNPNGYYLGNIVIVRDSENNGKSNIVDGQQRLVTLSLIAKSLLNKITDPIKVGKLKDIIWSDIENTVPRIKFLKEELNIIYKKLLEGDTGMGELNNVEKVLSTAYDKIERVCSSLVDIDIFLQKFLDLEFVVIKSPSEDDVYLLFEGLNSTGLSLSAIELTKNSLLGKIKALNPTRVQDAINIWEEIEKNFNDADISITWFSKFLRHQWFNKNGYITNPKLFKEIKIKLINKDGVLTEELFDYLNELKDDAKMYVALRKSNLNKGDFDWEMDDEAWKKINKIIFNTKDLGLDQVYSVFLAFYKFGKHYPNYFKDGRRFKKHMELIWAFVFIVKFTQISPSLYEKKFADLCKDIRDKEYSDFKSIMSDFYKNDLFPLIDGVSKDKFAKTISEELTLISFDIGLIRLVLEEYLTFLDSSGCTGATIEHIVPENDLSLWVNILDKDNIIKYVGHIGNLTLLNEELNRDADNKDFYTKDIIAYQKSGYQKNKVLAVEWGDMFNSENPANVILKRGRDIGENLYIKYNDLLK